MSLATQVQNLATETSRRWRTLRGGEDEGSRRQARDLLAKLALGAWLLAGNLLRAALGSRVHHQVLTIRRFQRRMVAADEARLLAQLDHAVGNVLWHLALARRDGIGVRRVERLMAEFVDAAEADLAKLSRLARG